MKVALPASFESIVLILSELGLTTSEAKAYIALLQNGKSTIDTISKTTGIHRTNLYKIIQSLENKNLVERELKASATRYRAIPFCDGISMLLDRKRLHMSELTSKTKTAIAQFERLKQPAAGMTKKHDADSQYLTVVPRKRVIIEKQRKSIHKTALSIDIVTSKKRFSNVIEEFMDDFQLALKRGVTIRIATEAHNIEKTTSGLLQTLQQNPNFEVRHIPSPINAIGGIFDNKEVCLILSPTTPFAASPALWSNNNCLIHITQTYFETHWKTTQPPLQQTPNKL
ncbi:MAG: hypothetical protein NWF04_02970 [Candidatus Bathyarchaeota archaeon]|nr:hypothetical protein [Candidatus Bathyarchaeota archaeon]